MVGSYYDVMTYALIILTIHSFIPILIMILKLYKDAHSPTILSLFAYFHDFMRDYHT